jgi:hypothetical protein
MVPTPKKKKPRVGENGGNGLVAIASFSGTLEKSADEKGREEVEAEGRRHFELNFPEGKPVVRPFVLFVTRGILTPGPHEAG